MELAGFDFAAQAPGRHTELNERICRTILGGAIIDVSGIRAFNSADMHLLDLLLSWLEGGNALDNKTLALDNMTLRSSLLLATNARTYFRSHNCGHGLCYPTCKPDDQVWVLHGAKVLFILRPVHVDMNVEENVLRPSKAYIRDETGSVIGVEPGFEPRTGHYQLVGDCYYDGFMYGEGLDDERFPVQSILLV